MPRLPFKQLAIGAGGGSQGFQLFDDFIGSTTPMVLGWAQDVSGAGASVAVDTTLVSSSAAGVISLATGTTAAGRAVQFLGTLPIVVPAAPGSLNTEWRVRLPVLSVAAERFFANIGFQDNPDTSTEGVDAIGFRLPTDNVSLNWVAYNVEVSVDTGVAAVANAWQRLRIEADMTGGARFYIGDSPGGADVLVATITGPSLPIAAIAPCFKLVKTVGVTSRTMFADYAVVHGQYSPPR